MVCATDVGWFLLRSWFVSRQFGALGRIVHCGANAYAVLAGRTLPLRFFASAPWFCCGFRYAVRAAVAPAAQLRVHYLGTVPFALLRWRFFGGRHGTGLVRALGSRSQSSACVCVCSVSVCAFLYTLPTIPATIRFTGGLDDGCTVIG